VPKVVGGASPSGGADEQSLSRDRAARHYAAIVESSDDAILSKDLEGVITSWNRGAQRLFGYAAEEVIGRSVTIIIPTDRHDEEPMILGRIRRGERIEHYETVRQRKDGSLVDISITVSPIRSENGEIVGASKIARDITLLKRARERQDLLLREMNHRVKNLFSLAISVLRLSGRSAGSVSQLVESTSDRLSALARAHALTLAPGTSFGDLSQAAKPTTLHSLVQAITAPHDVVGDSDGSKFSVTGCEVEIATSVISSLALLLNEFATNATKYGALSTTAGRIQIQCVNRGEILSVSWTERGGPEIEPPTNKGFGDHLVRTTIASLGGEISRDWHPEGLVIRLSIPRERLTN
jgi:PAS domain S-box-containing protein